MENKKEVLEIIRKLTKSKDVKIKNYKPSTIRSVMFGQRNNNEILEHLLKHSIQEIETMKKELVYALSTMYTENIQNTSSHPFLQMNKDEKVEFLASRKTLSEIQELKKELIKFNVWDELEKDVQMFLNNLSGKSLKMIRHTRQF